LGVKRREEKTEKRSKKRRVLSLDKISCLRSIELLYKRRAW
jgi:hypothetical protein